MVRRLGEPIDDRFLLRGVLRRSSCRRRSRIPALISQCCAARRDAGATVMQAEEVRSRFGRCPYCRAMIYQDLTAIIFYCSKCRTPIRGTGRGSAARGTT